ncbi:hypothetical protein NMG60_11000811 [Bertholletia excelsa]
MKDAWANRKESLLIAAPSEERKILNSRQSIREGIRAGAKAAAVTCVATAVPTLAAVRVIPWAKASINHTGQALIISAASIAAFFIAADKTILECARRNTEFDRSL